MQQMQLPSFLREFDMPRTNFERLVFRRDNPLPAYKVGGRWYVDIPKYLEWREEEHKRQTRAMR